MLRFPKKWIRQITYAITFFFIILILLLVANKHEVIELPENFTPSFFQPKSDIYIIDVAVKGCFKLTSSKDTCGVISSNEGEFDEFNDIAEWVRLDKDLKLGSSWYNQLFLSYKKVSTENIRKKEAAPVNGDDSPILKGRGAKYDFQNKVIVDIAIYEPGEDSKIQGNEKKKFPLKVIKDIHATRVYNDDYHAELVEKEGRKQSSGHALTLDQDKTTSNRYAKEDVEAKEKQNEAAKSDNNSGDEKKSRREDSSDDSSFEAHPGETNRHGLKLEYAIPTKEQLEERKWKHKGYGIWVRYGNPGPDIITGLDVLFGKDAVEPRPNWELMTRSPLQISSSSSSIPAYLTIRRGAKVDYKQKYNPTLKFNKDGTFKILQVADLHFSTGVGKCRDHVSPDQKKKCEADPITLEFLEKVLDIEKPDFVVMTGDQVFGDEAPDAETAIFKSVHPFIKRKIPFAVTLGNHDDEGSLTRSEVMSVFQELPYSFSSRGPEDVPGFGNYALTIEGASTHKKAAVFYFLDTHKYSLIPKVSKGYDWVKESQLKYLEKLLANLKSSLQKYTHVSLSMAFFHIPLPEFRNLNQPFIGEAREGVTAPGYNSGTRTLLGKLGVDVISVGHDHCNDYCLLDTQKVGPDNENKMWLCYGGGVGEGGYGGYNSYVRRLRVFSLDTNKGEIKSWKRKQDNPEEELDHQTLVSGGQVVNFA